MAGNDIFLFSVPSDTDQDDVRLRDPTTLGATALNLAATEAADIAAFNVQEGFVLTATEAADIAAFSVQEGFRLAATEAADVAAFGVTAAAAASNANDDHDYWRSYRARNAKARAKERRQAADVQAWLAGLDAPPVVAKPVIVRRDVTFVTHTPEPAPALAAVPQQLVLELPAAVVRPRHSVTIAQAIAAYRASRRPVVDEAVAAYRRSKHPAAVSYRRSRRQIVADAIAAYRLSKAA